MVTVNEVLKQAQEWLGKNEKDGSHKEIIDIYNSFKPLARGYKVPYDKPWCATTISALFIKLKATDIMPTECSCEKMIALCKSKGIFIEDESITPKPGDIIFYDWDDTGTPTDNKGWSDHVGIVEKVSAKTVTVIEGNYKNAVARRKITVNQTKIRGYARPKYKEKMEDSTLSFYKCVNYKGTSIVDALKSIGEKSDYATRKKIAAANGVKNYRGSSKSNTQLLNLLKKGKLIKP